MAVKSHYAVAIATLSDWLKKLAPSFQPMRSRSKTKTSPHLARVTFPALWTSYRLLPWVLIGPSRCLLLFWLVGVITLGSVFPQLFENRAIIIIIIFLLRENDLCFIWTVDCQLNCPPLALISCKENRYLEYICCFVPLGIFQLNLMVRLWRKSQDLVSYFPTYLIRLNECGLYL